MERSIVNDHRRGRRALALSACAGSALRLLACGVPSETPSDTAAAADASMLDDAEAALRDARDDGAAAREETSLPDGGATSPPTYCQGVTFFADFDQGVAPRVGNAAPRILGTVGSVPGRFGSAASLTLGAGAPGAAIFYDLSDGGPPFYDATEGTIAFWFKRENAGTAGDRSYVRPMAPGAALRSGGPAVASGASERFGVFDFFEGHPLATLSFAEMEPYRRPGEFDHFVTAWRTSDDAGTGGVALVVLNGGLGQVFGDAGADGSVVDAAADDAGDYQTPYAARHAVDVPRWEAPYTVRVGGVALPKTTTPEGDIDDLAIWNRILTREEIAALYASATSLRVTCNLP